MARLMLAPAMAMMYALVMAMMYALVMAMALTAHAAAAPPKVTGRGIVYRGNGCNYYDTNLAFSSDYQKFIAIFRGMDATTDSGLAGLSLRRKFCHLSFYLDYPNGWSLTFGNVTARFNAIQSNVFYEIQFYFSGQTGTATVPVRRTISGRPEKFLTLVYSQCNSAPNLNIKTVVRVDGRKAEIGVDSSDTKFQLLFACVWKRC